ncbi:hydroxyethylthiazole kinase [Subtercola frigoramans]|uniref:Hydroxyethylthiazole kinase n=1 Tax=Subtercola frigoramans TaxID=120298 RepID=A0ABS2L400_9MICO|nr:hydroxyethylthiazole kinase [Subtercola frigoramans]MBM7471793.1 hydroxyethylthiazole kinase [Subtercola frigoramans]
MSIGGPTPVTAHDIGNALRLLRENPPLVQCITNIVVAQWTANVLLAAGAAPAMVDNPREAGGFASIASGVLINLGTPYDDTALAMLKAVKSAGAAGVPWVLDPVAVGPLAWRTELAHHLLDTSPPHIIRGNASEILALAGGAGGRGVDTTDTAESAVDAADSLAREYSCVVAVSGEVDQLTDGVRRVRIHNGHPLMTQVTGVGCALGALMAGFSGVVDEALLAAAAATATLTVAADLAAAHCRGTGSFAVGLLDELTVLTPERLEELTRLS